MFGWGWLNEMTNVQGKRNRHSDGDSKRNPSVPNYNATAAAVRQPSTRKSPAQYGDGNKYVI
jgi:hypothetical protein